MTSTAKNVVDSSNNHSQNNLAAPGSSSVLSDYLESASRDKAYEHLFKPTRFLNPGFGILFQHIGSLHQSVYKHYVIIALEITTIKHVPR